MKKRTMEDFITNANYIHNNKYDYSLVEYKNQKSKIKIICNIHGIFEQRLDNHLIGQGCPYCGGTNKLTIDNFIERSNEIHYNKYDYSLVYWKNSYTKVKIICPIHGEFIQKPDNHMNQKQGCPECGKLYKKSTLEKFIKKSIEIHGDKYDYSLVEYVGANIPVKIICKLHGIFEQTPNHHTVNKHGCRICKIENETFTKEDFIKKSIEIHGDKYDYSLVEYKNSQTKVKIYCKEHDLHFDQIPNNHIRNQGCKYCGIKKIRLNFLNELQYRKNNGFQISPNFNKDACEVFDEIMLKENIHIQHAMNGGEYYIKELGYWLDGYDKDNNIAYEFDEKYHENPKQKEKDIIRQQEIEKFLKCTFIRLK